MTALASYRKIGMYGILPILLLVFMSACTKKKRLNEQLTFWKNDKIPYGTYYSYQQLSTVFPGSEVTINRESPDKYNSLTIEDGEVGEDIADTTRKSAYLIITPVVMPDKRELQAMLNYITAGNHIFISTMQVSPGLLDSLRLTLKVESGYEVRDDSLTISLIHPRDIDTAAFTYPGMQLDNFLTGYDTSITEILGYNSGKHPNFVRFRYESGGSLSLHFAPAAFTNFFLLHKNNKIYYDQAMSYLPPNLQEVVWDEYFRYHQNGSGKPNNDFSALSWMMKQPALAWMTWILLLLFLLIYLFESKRRQRAIPLRPRPKNASVDFVKTIGRLYFQRKDNKNLALKMTTHFLEQLRMHYNISTSQLDANFEKKLSYKSGHSAGEVNELVRAIQLVQQRPLVDDELILSYQTILNRFLNTIKNGR